MNLAFFNLIFILLDPISTIFDYKSVGLLIVSVGLTMLSYNLIYKVNDKLAQLLDKLDSVLKEFRKCSDRIEELNRNLDSIRKNSHDIKNNINIINEIVRENKYVNSAILDNTKGLKDTSQSLQIQLSTVATSLASLIDNFKEIIAKLIDNLNISRNE